MGVNFKRGIELPGEHTVAFLIFLNTFHVNRNPFRRLQLGIIEIPDICQYLKNDGNSDM